MGIGVLGAPLIVVLGHTGCGAVEAAVKIVKDHTKFLGAIGMLVAPIVPAVRSVKGDNDLLNRSVRANVVRVTGQLRGARPILSKAVKEQQVKVVGAVYDLQSGAVDFFEPA